MLNLGSKKILSIVNTPVLIPLGEQSDYTNGNLTNGYGQCSGVYVTVQKGTSAVVKVDFTIKTVSDKTFSTLQQNVKTYLKQDVSNYLDEHYKDTSDKPGWLASLFGGESGNGYDHYINQSSSFDCQSDQNYEQIAKMVHDLETQNFHVTGKLTAVGTSNIPATVSVYVQISTIQFADGTHINVIDPTAPKAADKNGDTSGATIDPGSKLNIVPLS